jgi:hypothetical protein
MISIMAHLFITPGDVGHPDASFRPRRVSRHYTPA